MRILVTGATGAIGYPFVHELLAHGHEVSVIARTKKNRSLEEISALFKGSVKVIYGDMELLHCGVTHPTITALVGDFDALVHAAGVTQYHEHLREQTFNTNVNGTKNVLQLAEGLRIPSVALVSTAYVGGKKSHFSEAELGLQENAHNPYEGSKIEVEELFREYPGNSLILRLSTIIGDSETGFIVNAGGYAGFAKGFWALRQRIGQYPDNPFYVGVNRESTLNLLPNDWAVDHMRKAIEARMTGNLHLTHPKPVNMGWLFDVTFAGFPLTSEEAVAGRTALLNDSRWVQTQRAIDKLVDYFHPYVTRDTVFGHEKVQKISGYVPPPVIDEVILSAQTNYMMNHLFPKIPLR